MHQATGQESSSSSSSLLQHLSSEGSSSTSTNTGGHGSNSTHIDLTQPRPPRIVHPGILPSQTIEIIDLSSDDEASYSGYYSNNNTGSSSTAIDGDDEVQFVRETPGTATAGRGSNSRHADAGIGGSGSYARGQSSSFPGSETLLHAYHLGRHPSFSRSQETPGLARNRSEGPYTALANRGGSNSRIPPPSRHSPLFHPYTATNAQPTRHPSEFTRALASGSGSAIPQTHTLTEYRALASAVRAPPRHHPPNPNHRPNLTTEYHRTERSLLSMFARFFDEEDHLDAADRLQRAARRLNSQNHTFTHTHHHYWEDQWDAPHRERSPSVFGELLERLGVFDGAPPAATEAEVEQERSEIETKPVLTRPGFTKTINPETVITCPLCTKAFGHDGDNRPTLWVIIGCGHVVCGTCAGEMFISRKVIRGATTKGRRQSMSKRAKGKGKAKWSPGPTDMEAGGEDENLDTTSDGVAPTSPTSTTATSTENNIKVTKKVMGNCPGCQRKIRNTSLQQLYL
ncbi:MAG: hypothetical protein J3R72DRAFT_455219 [Linnemannia gamsii]|nr:MAG: hypothetical protein J3R72DRAFT_455219 [Linnemannia gamsii]